MHERTFQTHKGNKKPTIKDVFQRKNEKYHKSFRKSTT